MGVIQGAGSIFSAKKSDFVPSAWEKFFPQEARWKDSPAFVALHLELSPYGGSFGLCICNRILLAPYRELSGSQIAIKRD